MNRNKRNILKGLLLGLWAWAGTACTDPAEEQGYYGGLRPGEVALQWVGPNMGVQHVKARGTDTKTALEQQINEVHVFIFDQDGNYLAASDNDAFQGYQYVAKRQSMVLNTNLFESETKAENATVVAVANVPEGTFGTTNAGRPERIKNINDFAQTIYNLSPFTTNLPEGELPMIGVARNVNLTPNAAQKITIVQMQSLMARIDLNFTMDPYQSSDDGQNPSLRIDEVRVGNFPSGGTIDPQLDHEINTGTTNAEVTDNQNGQITLKSDKATVTDFTGHILREGEPQSLTLYMFEHARAAKALSDVFGTDSYPENITEEEKQRYKNDLAHDEAAYIELEGVYTNHNDYKYAVTYRLYPGKNAVDDFTIRHNRQYIHNITVTGITVNNMGEEALLDTRVDIDNEENPYFIEMLREREHDAHFNVTPMDVFIYKGGSVKVEILDENGGPAPDWIRMEPMRYSPTAGGKVAATEAGEGKRPYFLTNLVQGENGGEGILDQNDYNTSYTVTSPDATKTYEERIYFYIDENVPTRQQANNREEVEAREATLRITYTKPEGSTGIQEHTRDIIIRQAGMLPVTYREAERYTFYIESFEEYLEHYDGKDRYNHTYDGLEWGFTGVLTELGGMHEYMPYGWRNTMQIMEKFREETRGGGIYAGELEDMTLNMKPRGAAEYCYNKNKRNEQGEVETCHWFLPTIREMEDIIKTHYGRFDGVFQDNWYWSSNPGGGPDDRDRWDSSPTNITWSGESVDYARATKVKSISGNNADYFGSEANKPFEKIESSTVPGKWDTWYDPTDYGRNYPKIFDNDNYANLPLDPSRGWQGGFARRNKVLRIRAAYIVESPNNSAAPLNN